MELDYEKSVEYIAELYNKKDSPKMIDFEAMSSVNVYGPVIEDDIARLFKVFLHAIQPRRILEIGMSIGFSTTILANVAKFYNGRVTTIELNPEVVPHAQKNFEREGVNEIIDIEIGNAMDILPTLGDGSFDVVFQDSSKRLYPTMLDDCLRVLRRGGLFLVDDTLWPAMIPSTEWDESKKGIHEFNKQLIMNNVESTVVTIGEGCTVAIKL
ncbi:MAG: O-methyltransferase [Candidatus Thorarchaeota archaeon]